MNKRFSRKVGGRSRRRRRSVSGKILPPIDVRSPSSFGEMVKRITKGPLTVVLVYADWCGHCHQFMPHFDAAAKDSNRTIQAVKLNETMVSKANDYLNKNVNKNAKPINVEGYPSVLLVKKDGSIVSEVEAEKNTDAMKKVMTQVGPVAEEAGLDTSSPMVSLNHRNQMAVNLGMEEKGAVNATESVRNYDVNEGSMLGTQSMDLTDNVSMSNRPIRTDTNTSMNVSRDEVKTIASLQSVNGSMGTITVPPRMVDDMDVDMEVDQPRTMSGGSLYQALSKSAYTLAPAAVLLAAAAGLRRGKHRGTKKRGKKLRKTKHRSRK